MEPEKEEKKNPIKRAEKEKEFRTVGQFKEVYRTSQEIYQAINKYTNSIKKVANQHPRAKEYEIIDFSLNARGPDEDKIYVKHEFYRQNIRRGNTVIYNKKQKQAHWGRKGLMKFFDIAQSSLKAMASDDLASLSKKDLYNHYSVFKQIENVLSCNDELEQKDKAKVHVYRLNKANGQNAQVSYFKLTDEWVVSSKNVSIMIRSVDDLKFYDGQRYQFAKLIAKTWFQLLKGKNKNQIAQLKQDLEGMTIIGEYCGNPDFQHLVKYHEVTIFFYALVENTSIYSCLPPAEAFKFFQSHKLPIVKNHEKSFYGKYSNFTQLGKGLIEMFSLVATSSIFDDQEGSVVYFVIQMPKVFCEYISDHYLQKTVPIPEDWQKQQTWWHVSSLGKLKTIEYRILRKLREKLKFFTRMKHGGDESVQKKQNDYKKFQEKYGSFQKECFQLLKGQKLNKPIQYYFCIALFAFDYVYKNRKSSKNLELLIQHFLDFLSVIFWSVQNKKEVSPGLMSDWKLHEELRGQTWQNYSTDIVKDYDQLLQKIVPRYAEIKKKLKIEAHDEQGSQEEGEQPEE